MAKKTYQDRQLIEITKYEYRISKYEIKSNYQNSNDKNRNMTWKTLQSDVVLVIETLGFKICFEFLISNFEFPDKQRIKKSEACLVLLVQVRD